MVRNRVQSSARAMFLCLGLATILPGCGSQPAGVSEEAGKVQAESRNAWAKAKSEGTAVRTNKGLVDKTPRRGAVNRPGG